MKISIVGTGSIGKRHLKNCITLKNELGISEIRCFDEKSSLLQEIKQEMPDVILTNDIKSAVDGVDAVFICVPTSLHIPVISEISKICSCHIYLEKPVSHTLSGCDELIYKQKKSNKVLAVGYMLPKHPVLLEIKKLLSDNIAGRILSVRAESGFYLPKWHPWENYKDFYMSWKTGGGGALLDSSHEINYLQWLFGDISEVQGFYGKVSDLEITSDDLAVAIFHFKNGIIGQLHLDLLQFDESRYCKIIGTEAVLIGDLIKNEIKYSHKNNETWKKINVKVDFDEIYYNQLKNFIAACNGKEYNLITGEESVKTLQVVEAIRKSCAYSTSVKLPLFE